MIRQVIQIDEEKCDGCGRCVNACHEGAIALVGGKARLIRDDYCDGLGDCLPSCPTGAITFVEREAAAYDEAAVQAAKQQAPTPMHGHSGCPGSRPHVIAPAGGCPGSRPRMVSPAGGCPSAQPRAVAAAPGAANASMEGARPSAISSWPLEIKLVPINAPYFEGAHLLVAADCTAFAYGDFHRDFMSGRTTVIGCPKLDAVDYSEKLQAIIESNNVQSITVARMEVPCCGGLEFATREALARSGKNIPFNVVTIGIDGRLL